MVKLRRRGGEEKGEEEETQEEKAGLLSGLVPRAGAQSTPKIGNGSTFAKCFFSSSLGVNFRV